MLERAARVGDGFRKVPEPHPGQGPVDVCLDHVGTQRDHLIEIGERLGILLEIEMDEAAVDVRPGNLGPQRDARAVAGSGLAELAQPDIAVAEKELVHEILRVDAGDSLDLGHDFPTFLDRSHQIRVAASIEPVEDVPEPIHRRAERDFVRPRARSWRASSSRPASRARSARWSQRARDGAVSPKHAPARALSRDAS